MIWSYNSNFIILILRTTVTFIFGYCEKRHLQVVCFCVLWPYDETKKSNFSAFLSLVHLTFRQTGARSQARHPIQGQTGKANTLLLWESHPQGAAVPLTKHSALLFSQKFNASNKKNCQSASVMILLFCS